MKSPTLQSRIPKTAHCPKMTCCLDILEKHNFIRGLVLLEVLLLGFDSSYFLAHVLLVPLRPQLRVPELKLSLFALLRVHPSQLVVALQGARALHLRRLGLSPAVDSTQTKKCNCFVVAACSRFVQVKLVSSAFGRRPVAPPHSSTKSAVRKRNSCVCLFRVFACFSMSRARHVLTLCV